MAIGSPGDVYLMMWTNWSRPVALGLAVAGGEQMLHWLTYNRGEMMTNRSNQTRLVAALLAVLTLATACTTAADRASDNLSEAAENFEIERRVVFINGITDNYMLEIVGRCSIEDQGTQLEVTCLEGPDQFRKHFLGLSDNVSYFVEQLEAVPIDTYRYKVRFRPESILPDVDVDTADPDSDG